MLLLFSWCPHTLEQIDREGSLNTTVRAWIPIRVGIRSKESEGLVAWWARVLYLPKHLSCFSKERFWEIFWTSVLTSVRIFDENFWRCSWNLGGNRTSGGNSSKPLFPSISTGLSTSRSCILVTSLLWDTFRWSIVPREGKLVWNCLSFRMLQSLLDLFLDLVNRTFDYAVLTSSLKRCRTSILEVRGRWVETWTTFEGMDFLSWINLCCSCEWWRTSRRIRVLPHKALYHVRGVKERWQS